MPGPCNKKKKRRPAHKTQKTKNPPEPDTKLEAETCDPEQKPGDSSPSSSRTPSQHILTPPPIPYCPVDHPRQPKDWEDLYTIDDTDPNSLNDDFFLPPPYIYDPGNGPRVRDTQAFISSKYFAQEPAMHIPLCAEFAQPEILEMLRTILPEETALILWYNKSRATSRICPACQRLYRLGESLPELVVDDPLLPKQRDSPYIRSEQEISGLCSPVCFILASFNYPGAIKKAWGRTVDEIDDDTWEIMNGPGGGNNTGELGTALGMLVRMTRLHDLGLGQLCFDRELDIAYDHIEDAVELSLDFVQCLKINA